MIRNIPKSLIEAAQEHIQIQLYESIMLVENRVQFLKDKNPEIDTSHDHFAQHKNSSDIIDHFATNADPTPNKSHTQWILGQYKKKNIRQEDAGKINGVLSHFEKYKSKLDKKDINQYKSVDEVDSAVIPHIGSAVTKKEKSEEAATKGRTLIHSNEEGLKVYRLEPTPEGKKASQDIYGGGFELGGTHTNWCTAGRSENCRFDEYNKHDTLFTIHTPTGNVFQASTKIGQLMDSKNQPVKRENQDIKHVLHALEKIPEGWKLKLNHFLPINKMDVESVAETPESKDYKGITVSHISELMKYNLSSDSLHSIIESHKVPVKHKIHFLENSKNIDDSLISKAISQNDRSLNMALLKFNNLNSEHLTKLINYPDVWVAHAALNHPNTTQQHIDYAVNHQSHSVRVIAAMNSSKLSKDQLEKLKNDTTPIVRNIFK